MDGRSNGDGSGGGGDDGGSGGLSPPGDSSVMKKTAQQIAGEQVLGRVVEAVDGVSFSFR